MRLKKIVLLCSLVILYFIFLVVTLWSFIGLLLSLIGLYYYWKPTRRRKLKYPLFVVWLGVIVAFIIAVYAVPETVSETKALISGSSSDKKIAALKKQNKELSLSLKKTQFELKKEKKGVKKLKEMLEYEKELRLQTVDSYQSESDKRSKAESDLEEEISKRVAAEEKIAELESSLADIGALQADMEESSNEEYIEEDLEEVTDTEYDPFGTDRDCSDFSSPQAAQDFYLAAGGPVDDPHDLDRDHDGNACDWN